jgi:hypothetical protein
VTDIFPWLARVMALANLALFGVLLVNGAGYLQAFGLAADAGGLFVAQRAAPVFAGLAVLLWLARDLPAGTGRDAVAISMAVIWAGIALTGVVDYLRGQAGAPILLAAAAEVVAAALFLIARRG